MFKNIICHSFNSLIISVFLVLTASTIPLIALEEARAELITFDEYPEGTPISVQYQDQGVKFLGATTILRYSDDSGGALKISVGTNTVFFVDPTDSVTPVEAKNIQFEAFYLFLNSVPTTVAYYDISGNLIRDPDVVATWTDPPTYGSNPPTTPFHKIVFTIGGSNKVRLDNLSFQTLFPSPTLVDPGPSTECEAQAGQPINLTTGDVWISNKDYSVPGLAGGLSVSRIWNSLWNQSNPLFESGMFGRGWTSDFEERLQVFNSAHIIYWLGSGNTWVFEAPAGCSSCAYNLVSPANQQATLQYDSTTTTYTVSFKNGTKKVFSDTGLLLAVIDRNGNQTTVSYDSFDRITNISAPGGQWISYAYDDSQNEATSAYDAVGTIASFSYVDGNLTQAVYADISQLNYEYDNASNIISVTDSEGKVLETHTYDINGRGLSSSRADSADSITIHVGALRKKTVLEK